MEKTVGTLAVHTVTTNLVTNLMDDVFIVVQTASMVNCVIKVNSNEFHFSQIGWLWHQLIIPNLLTGFQKICLRSLIFVLLTFKKNYANWQHSVPFYSTYNVESKWTEYELLESWIISFACYQLCSDQWCLFVIQVI